MRSLGIDVSHHQGEVNWFAVASSLVKFAFVKATEGTTFIDPRFEENWRRIREVGLFRGAYHFARPGRDPEAQAEHFAAVVGPLDFRDLPPVLDLEVDDGHGATHVLDWARRFTERAERLFRRRVILYTGGFWRFDLGNPKDSFFAERPLWLAAYTPEPVVPASWNHWTFWQFSEGTLNAPTNVPGLRGRVDQNWFQGGEPELDVFCKSSVLPAGGEVPVESAVPGSTFPGVYFLWPKQPPVANPHVGRWQRRMNELGFVIDVDGVYGPQSKAACEAFQREAGASVDGIVGPRTWDLCFAPRPKAEANAGEPSPPTLTFLALTRGHRGPEVARWQAFLREQNILPDAPDGSFGPETQAATQRFQQREGLPASGTCDEPTLLRARGLGYRLFRRLRDDEVTVALRNRAKEILSEAWRAPFGTEVPFEIDGQPYFARIEQHYHPPGGPQRPWGYHAGVSLFFEG